MRLFTLLLAIVCFTNAYSQFVEIPDENFVTYLQNNYPSCMIGNTMNTMCSDIQNEDFLDCSSSGITNLDGIQYFISLVHLKARANSISSIDGLPHSIQILNLSSNPLTDIAFFPEEVENIDLSYTQITTIPTISEGLLEFNSSGCDLLETLPVLPESTREIHSRSCNTLTTVSSLPEDLITLNLSQCDLLQSVSSFPQNLTDLDIEWCDNLTSIPELPESMLNFYRSFTPDLDWVDIPDNLFGLRIESCNLYELELSNSSLNYLIANFNPTLESISLPSSINYLEAQSCGLDYVPYSPSLIEVWCGYNPITDVYGLSDNIRNLYINNTDVTSIEMLPAGLEVLDISGSPVTYIDEIPNNLLELYASNCPLNYLPELPMSMYRLNVNDTPLECVYNLPESVNNISLDDTNLACLPNIPSSTNLPENIQNMPLCEANDPINNPFECSNAQGLEGNVHLDNNFDCAANDAGLDGIPLKFYENGILQTTTSTLPNGRFFKSADYANHEIVLDINSTPFNVTCLNPGLDSAVVLNSFNLLEDSIDFVVNCAEQTDFIIASHLTSGLIFPGELHRLSLLAGEISGLYNGECFPNIPSTLTLNITGPASIYTPSEDALIPTFSDQTATYEIDDMSAVNFSTLLLSLQIYVESTAQADDDICFEAIITSDEDETNIINNTLIGCYQVVNSYDPNNKIVSPYEVDPAFYGWLNYTINFQNTGNAPALNIRLEDQLSSDYNLSTFQKISASHDSYFELDGNDLSVFFPDIMLEDSTTNLEASTGYFQFRIKPNSPIQLGSIIENTAAIFFDFNDPIITNTATTEAVEEEIEDSVSEFSQLDITIYPNPSAGSVYINSKTLVKNVTAVNLLGEELKFDVYSVNGALQIVFGPQQKGLVFVKVETHAGVHFERLILR